MLIFAFENCIENCRKQIKINTIERKECKIFYTYELKKGVLIAIRKIKLGEARIRKLKANACFLISP